MRIVLVSLVLGLTASCAAPPLSPPPVGTSPTAAEIAAALGPAPTPLAPALAPAVRPVRPGAEPGAPPPPVVVGPPPPPPARPPGVATVDYVPIPLVWVQGLYAPAPGGRLTLSNFSFDEARVQAVPASGPECTVPDGAPVADFVLPLNGTRIIAAPPGADICWRREMPPPTAQGGPPASPWTPWNRAYTAAGRFIDSRL